MNKKNIYLYDKASDLVGELLDASLIFADSFHRLARLSLFQLHLGFQLSHLPKQNMILSSPTLKLWTQTLMNNTNHLYKMYE